MAGKDITEKVLESYNDVFSDMVNVLFLKERKYWKRMDWKSGHHVRIIRQMAECMRWSGMWSSAGRWEISRLHVLE